MRGHDLSEKEKIDIAIFPGTLARGGAERVSVRLSECFSRHGKRVAIVTGRARRESDYPVPKNVKFFYVSRYRDKFLSLALQYRKIIKDIRPRTIIIMGMPLCCTVVPAALFTESKVIVSERNSPKNFAGKKITKILMNFFMRFADGYVFQTQQAKEHYGRKIQGKATVIPNPIIINELPERSAPFRKEIVGVGRLNPQKNWPLLIRVFARISPSYPEWKLIIYGEGKQRGELENLIQNLRLDTKVFLPGAFDDVLEKICRSGVFVLPSNFEGMPNALMEAMAIGLPCIATDCPSGGPAELIENGKNGVLIKVDDNDALFSALQDLLNESDKAEKMGIEAGKIRAIFDIEKIATKWLEFIREF